MELQVTNTLHAAGLTFNCESAAEALSCLQEWLQGSGAAERYASTFCVRGLDAFVVVQPATGLGKQSIIAYKSDDEGQEPTGDFWTGVQGVLRGYCAGFAIRKVAAQPAQVVGPYVSEAPQGKGRCVVA